MKITFYSTGCPKCKVLKSKLDAKGLKYEVIDSAEEMLAIGLKSAPALKVDENPVMKFAEAVKWVNSLEV